MAVDPPGDGFVGLGSANESPLLDALHRWAAEARVDEAAQARLRERWLLQQAAEDATFTGTLVDLAERGHPIGVHTAGGRRHRGAVTAVGSDFFALRTVQGGDVLVPFDATSFVQPQSGQEVSLGDRSLTVDLLFSEALQELSVDRPRVLVIFRGDQQGIAGELRSVGRDVVTIRLDGSDGSNASVPLLAVAEVCST
ncbi:MAG: hypothetical protein OEU32_20090 [Acidimicrobiia bacterium]|nr:hypothetical protein [Acidimicrobiia bacterium]